jgi:hypothetical protein
MVRFNEAVDGVRALMMLAVASGSDMKRALL